MQIIIVISAVFLFALTVQSSTTKKCNTIASNTCFQKCENSTSCTCASSDGDYAYTECSQTCERNKCKKITCSSRSCYQKCHDCQMECSSDVDYCNQQCLSGACSFKCSAKRCVQVCDGNTCKHLPSEHEEPFIPRLYLVILAGLFAATTVLTCLALALSCSQMGFRRRRRRRPAPLVNRNLGSSIRSFLPRSTIV